MSKIKIDTTSSTTNTQFNALKSAFEDHINNKDSKHRHLSASELYNFKKMVSSRVPTIINPEFVYDDTQEGLPAPQRPFIAISNVDVENFMDEYFMSTLGLSAEEYDTQLKHIYGIQYPRFEGLYGQTSNLYAKAGKDNATYVYGPQLSTGMGDQTYETYADTTYNTETIDDNYNHLGHFTNLSRKF